MTEAKLHLQPQLQGNSCKDELALTGPFVLRHHSPHTQIRVNTKMRETHTHTHLRCGHKVGSKQRNGSRRSFYINHFMFSHLLHEYDGIHRG